MTGEAEDDIPDSGAVFTFGKSKFAGNIPSKFWLKNDIPLKIACGDEHTALITENGKLFMFGSNNWGQLGLGSKTSVTKPTCVKALKTEKVDLVACGRNHTIVCTSRGIVYTCGGNSEGQLGLGDYEERTAFQRVNFFCTHGPIKMLAAGSNTSAALTESGKLFMWGDNTEGQLGLGEESSATTPREVTVDQAVSWVSCGYYHSAFVTVDGGLYTFGECDSGKLGLATEQLANHNVPQLVKGIKEPVTQVACGGGHTVALTEEDVYTFGLGQYGQLGHGTFIFETPFPRVVEHFRRGRVKHIMCGENHTAVVTDSGLLYTFGDGRHGKLGLGEENFTNQFKPTLCPRFLKFEVKAVTCGGCHMMVLARSRDEDCEEAILEEDDVTEDRLGKSDTDLLGDTTTSLNRSLSARVRRRERESSSEQFGLMFHTLPPIPSSYLNAPVAVSSQTMPPRLLPISTPPMPPPSQQANRKGHNGIQQLGSTGSHQKEQSGDEQSKDDQSCTVENLSDNDDSVKDLGDTTDFLNMTLRHPGENTLTTSPVQKDLGSEDVEDAEEDDEDDEDREDEEDEEEEEEKEDEEDHGEEVETQVQSLQSQGPPAEGPLEVQNQKPEEGQKDSVPPGLHRVAGDSGEPGCVTEKMAESKPLNGTLDVEPKNQTAPNRKLSLFKRLSSTKAKQAGEKIEAPIEGTVHGEQSSNSPSGALESKDSDSSAGGGDQPKARGPGTRGARSATCTLL